MTEVLAPEANQQERRHRMRALAHRSMTADEFLYAYDGVEGRWELVDGEPRMMTGAVRRHNRIAGNIFAALRTKLRGTPCQPFGSDMGVKVDLRQVRYPDVSVLCDPRDDHDLLPVALFPSVLFEVFSPSTAEEDRGRKLLEYRRLPSVREIVHVDPETEVVELYERIGEREWRETTIARGETLRLASINETLLANDIFRRD